MNMKFSWNFQVFFNKLMNFISHFYWFWSLWKAQKSTQFWTSTLLLRLMHIFCQLKNVFHTWNPSNPKLNRKQSHETTTKKAKRKNFFMNFKSRSLSRAILTSHFTRLHQIIQSKKHSTTHCVCSLSIFLLAYL